VCWIDLKDARGYTARQVADLSLVQQTLRLQRAQQQRSLYSLDLAFSLRVTSVLPAAVLGSHAASGLMACYI
jgi:hypothetical protein